MIVMTKEYRTREGNPTIIYSVCGSEPYVVHGAYKTEFGWKSAIWTAHGMAYDGGEESNGDLIEVKPRINQHKWVNIYPGDAWIIHKTREQADGSATNSRLACVKLVVNCEEGEGL